MLIKKKLIDRIFKKKITSPITEKDIWIPVTDVNNYDLEVQTYKSKRLRSFFKTLDNKTGTISYSDFNRVKCIDRNGCFEYLDVLGLSFVDVLYPIQLPYMPSKQQFILYTQRLLFDTASPYGYDTVNFLYIIGPKQEYLKLKTYYKRVGEAQQNKWEQISEDEWEERLSTYEKRKMIEEAARLTDYRK